MYELPTKEWVVVFYPQTGATRLCPTADFAKNFVGANGFKSSAYLSPDDFRRRFDHVALERCWRQAHKHASWQMPKTAIGRIEDYSETPPDTDTATFVKKLWEFLQDIGDRVSTPQMKVEVKAKENYELKLGRMKDDLENGTVDQIYNKQARTVFVALLENGRQFLTEEDIKKLIYSLVAERKLLTKQEPWVIFQYYRPQFIKDGYVIRGRAPKKSRE